jgi:hypothetical protein
MYSASSLVMKNVLLLSEKCDQLSDDRHMLKLSLVSHDKSF